jgi:hypothetical protein
MRIEMQKGILKLRISDNVFEEKDWTIWEVLLQDGKVTYRCVVRQGVYRPDQDINTATELVEWLAYKDNLARHPENYYEVWNPATERWESCVSLEELEEIANPRRNIGLRCGCCGSWFETWEGYVNQDQDKGYGICASCQEWIGKRDQQEWEKLRDKMAESLSETNRAKFLAMGEKLQQAFTAKAIDEGIIQFQIVRT